MGVYTMSDFIVKPSEWPWGTIYSYKLEFLTGGHQDWFQQSDYYKEISPAWKSGGITHNQNTWLSTTIPFSGTLSFYWSVSSGNNYDWLRYYVDDVLQSSISGNVAWTLVTVTIPSNAGTIVKWVYSKDGSVSSGQDCGWVSDILFSRG